MMQILKNWWLGYTPADLARARAKVERGEELDDLEYHAFTSWSLDDLSGVVWRRLRADPSSSTLGW
jgi:hypothetical protein